MRTEITTDVGAMVKLVKQAYDKAMDILTENQGKLHEIAAYLLEKETITGEEFMEILNSPMKLDDSQDPESQHRNVE